MVISLYEIVDAKFWLSDFDMGEGKGFQPFKG